MTNKPKKRLPVLPNRIKANHYYFLAPSEPSSRMLEVDPNGFDLVKVTSVIEDHCYVVFLNQVVARSFADYNPQSGGDDSERISLGEFFGEFVLYAATKQEVAQAKENQKKLECHRLAYLVNEF